jgi:hypothetical protein
VVEQDKEVVEVGEVVEGLELVLVLLLLRLRLHLHLRLRLHRIMRLLLRPIVLKVLQLHKHDDNLYLRFHEVLIMQTVMVVVRVGFVLLMSLKIILLE